MKQMLLIFAHPDDESFALGGKEYFSCDQELSAFPGRGKDLFMDLGKVEA